jgi:hypothetical protein
MNPITSEKDKLGFVGVGYMGRPIAQRLLEPPCQKVIQEFSVSLANTSLFGCAGIQPDRR